jgi:threonine dehydratase
MDARQQTCDELQQQTGATFIAPYNYGPVISGQGTIALELLQQVRGRSSRGQAALQHAAGVTGWLALLL